MLILLAALFVCIFLVIFLFNTDFRDRFNRHMNIIISNLVLLKVQFKTDAIKPI